MTTSELSLQANAACKDKGPEMFFVDEGPISNKSVRANIAKAISICNTCEVQDICLMTAVNSDEDEYGIWGGFTRKERRKTFSEGQKITIEEAKDYVLWKRSL
jgi:hypothetical protein